MKYVKVKWYDTSFYHDHEPMPEKEALKCCPMSIESVGYLLRDASDCLIAGSVGEEEGIPHFLDITCIPRGVVESIIPLKEATS